MTLFYGSHCPGESKPSRVARSKHPATARKTRILDKSSEIAADLPANTNTQRDFRREIEGPSS